MLVIFFDWQGVIHKEFFPESETNNAVYYKGVMERLLNRIRRVRPGMCESGNWFLLHDNAPSHNATIVKQFLAQRKVTVLDHPPCSPDLAPADYFLFPKVKPHLKGCTCAQPPKVFCPIQIRGHVTLFHWLKYLSTFGVFRLRFRGIILEIGC